MKSSNKNAKIGVFRHGDILLRQMDSIPSKAKKIRNKILAKGEKIGHHHKLVGNFQMYELEEPENTTRYLQIHEQTNLTHQEHNTILLPKGMHAVVHERKYEPFSICRLVEPVID